MKRYIEDTRLDGFLLLLIFIGFYYIIKCVKIKVPLEEIADLKAIAQEILFLNSSILSDPSIIPVLHRLRDEVDTLSQKTFFQGYVNVDLKTLVRIKEDIKKILEKDCLRENRNLLFLFSLPDKKEWINI